MDLKKFVQVIIILFLLILPVSVFAVKPVVLTDTLEELGISREYAEFFEDASATMTFSEILKLGDTSKLFIPSTAKDLVNENTGSVYWLKFSIVNQSKSHKPFRIEIFDYDIDEVSFFYEDTTGQYIEIKAGFSYPFYVRTESHKNISFKIPAHIPSSSNMYMRFYSKKHNVLEPIVRSYDRTLNYALNEYILFGCFYGLLLMMIFYNLLYFIILRRSYYFYYVFYGCGMLIYMMSSNGTGFQYLWPDFPWINNYIGETGLLIGTLTMLLFTNSFLRLKAQDKPLYSLLMIGFFLRILIYGAQLIYPHYYLFELFDLIYINAVFFIALKLYRSFIPSAKWLVIAYGIINIAFLVSLLEQTSVISSTILTVYSVNLGIILEFVFLSIGIAEMVKEAYKEKNEAQADLIIQYQQNEKLKEKVNRELEEKVRERTLELDNKNEELKRKAEENIKINISLDIANNELKKYLNTFAKSSVMKTHLDFEDFKKAYPDEISCIRYLRELKENKGFTCVKCGNNKSIKGKEKFDFRCSKCNYNESLTANTIFHRTKLSLQKAFYMLYIVLQKKGDISTVELAKVLELQNSTCSNYKKKIVERLQEQGKRSKHKELFWDNIILDDEQIMSPLQTPE